MNFQATYINLPHRGDRNAHMIKELQRVGLNANRFEAIRTKGSEWNEEPYKKMFARTRGAIGCMLSQMQAMERATEHAIILEDDLIFCDDFMKRLDMIAKFLETREWDIMWLGATVHYPYPYWHTLTHQEMPECKCTLNRDAEPTDHPNFLRSYGSFSTHAYIVNYFKIPTILTRLRDTMASTIGIDYSFIRLAPSMVNYVFIPGCVIQMDNKSDIGNGMTVFSGFKKLGNHWFKKEPL
jgi:GR25 family glycosyltransferase involved in LPS biosynthesis